MTFAAVCFLAASAGASAFAPVAPHPRLFADEAEFAGAGFGIGEGDEDEGSAFAGAFDDGDDETED